MLRSPSLGLSVVLGLLSAIGPFAIDMYLPALPAIGNWFHSSSSWVQASLGVFFLCFGASQLLYGPWSDRVGRKPPLLAGLLIFLVGSIGCALAPSIGLLIAFRCLQGLGAGAMSVIPRAVVRDLFTGVDAARMMARLMVVFSVSPILAPLSGSLVVQYLPWQWIFGWTGLFAVIGLLMTRRALPETRLPDPRQKAGRAWRTYLDLARDARFLILVGIGALGSAGFFVYLSGSSFVLINHYGLSPRQFSLAFSANAFTLIGCSLLSPGLAARHGLPRVLAGAVTAYALIMGLLAALSLGHSPSLPLMLGLLMAGYGCLGLVSPCTAVLALDAHGARAGAASAMLGTLQLAAGAVVIALISPFADGRPQPMLIGIALCASLAWALSHLARHRGYLDKDEVAA
ncbi:multidrug effflux MFS transporter [Frateuria aurantia]|uniref:Bcr/CflA family efflux transporter n=1 Tax=Frateuria aurantia (strain ATCC 33424 / DSM 6220 / KCTC 2777 / LMG 1558 / NBRC 3245 / NCIMB 13370) TaxID=767434 RepID=H8L0Y1_FRAAD|nr:multidrug effflux MFS transporter [Frateuria aurantia]AFC86301.1 drug resistance transporter, Bcr/CflA subfamily [Frateuria aurantia DSM 6220]